MIQNMKTTNEICQEDFHDPGTGITLKAGTYTRSVRDLLRRDEAKNRAERERQAAGIASLRRRGLSDRQIRGYLSSPNAKLPDRTAPLASAHDEADDDGEFDYFATFGGGEPSRHAAGYVGPHFDD
jgi:hypothetical protein